VSLVLTRFLFTGDLDQLFTSPGFGRKFRTSGNSVIIVIMKLSHSRVWSQIFGSASPIAPFYRFTIDITFTRSYTKKKLWWVGGGGKVNFWGFD
jgi:hypothetical protein